MIDQSVDTTIYIPEFELAKAVDRARRLGDDLVYITERTAVFHTYMLEQGSPRKYTNVFFLDERDTLTIRRLPGWK